MLFFKPYAEVKNGIVTISNIKPGTITNEIHRIFKTSRVNTYMFTHIGWKSISFFEFFALEMYYIIDELMVSKRRMMRVKDLLKIQDAIMEGTWVGKVQRDVKGRLDFTGLNRMSFTPLDYQRDFMNSYSYTVERYNLKGMLLAAKPGTGKTFTSLATAECLHAERIVVVCPKPAVDRVWYASCRGNDKGEGCVYKEPQDVWAYAHGKPYKGERILIFHYETLEKALDICKGFNRYKTVVILDESHNLNELSSLRTERFIELCKVTDSQDIIEATGTPVKAMSLETIPLLRAIDPLFTPVVEERFKKMYAGEVAATTAILARRLNTMTFKVEKAVLNLEKPEEETIQVEVPNGENYTLDAISSEMLTYIKERTKFYDALTPEAEKFFYQILDEYADYIGVAYRNPTQRREAATNLQTYKNNILKIRRFAKQKAFDLIKEEMKFCTAFEKREILPSIKDKVKREKFRDYKSIVKYPMLKIRGECLGRILGRKRIDAHLAMVPYIDFEAIIESSVKKTVIFSSFVEVLNKTETRLQEEGYKTLGVYGAKVAELASIVQKFERDKDANPLVASYAALSTAVPLTMADSMILINMPFRDYILEQTIARIHRLGANTQVRIFNTVLNTGKVPNISTRTTDILKWSRDQVNAIMGTSDDVGDEDTGSDVSADFAQHFGIEEFDAKPIVATEDVVVPKFFKW